MAYFGPEARSNGITGTRLKYQFVLESAGRECSRVAGNAVFPHEKKIDAEQKATAEEGEGDNGLGKVSLAVELYQVRIAGV